MKTQEQSFEVEIDAGSSIGQACIELRRAALGHGLAHMIFNGHRVDATPGMVVADIEATWWEMRAAREADDERRRSLKKEAFDDMFAALKAWAADFEMPGDPPPEPGSLHADMLAAIAKAEAATS